MDNRFVKKSYRVSLTAMFAALTLIMLYLAAILPTGRLAFYFLSSIFISAVLVERQPVMALMLYLVVSGLGLLIVPNLTMVLPYVLLFGHYGIGKYYIEKIKDKVTCFILKLLYFDLFLGLTYWLVGNLLLGSVLEQLQPWVLIVLSQVAFVIYDILYSKVTLYYYNNIRKKLVK